MYRNFLIILTFSTFLCSAAALGQDAGGDAEADRLSFAAFGTAGVVHSSEDRADFARSTLLPRGAGFSSRWATDVDSLVGGQVTLAATPKLSAIVQVVAEHRYDNSYRPHVEWANVKYEFNPDFSLRAGRIALPIFMFTEARRVGFALPWVRTPVEVYDLIPVTSNDGADVTWKLRLGQGVNTLQVAVGKSETKYFASGVEHQVQTSDQFTAANTYEIGELSLRANYGQARFTMDVFKPLFDGFRQLAFLGGDALADRYELDGRLARYMGVSASYQPGAWFAMGEWGRLETGALIGNRQGWYASAGRRLGNFTPYLTWGELRLTTPSSLPGLPSAGLPAELAAQVSFLDASFNAALNSAPRQSTATAGVRWDALRNLAIKLQYDRMNLGANSSGTLTGVQPSFLPGGNVHVISASVDFVL